MSTQELIGSLFKMVDLINFEWNVHFVFAVAFFGWLLSMKRNQPLLLKLFITIAVVLFAAFSMFTLNEYYRVLGIIANELKASTTLTTFKSSEVYDYINNFSTGNFKCGIWIVQLPIDFLLLAGLWYDKLWGREQ